MTKDHNIIYTYLLLGSLVIYMLKGALYPTGTLSVLVVIFEMGICVLLAAKNFQYKHKHGLIWILYFLLLLITVSFFISPKRIYALSGPFNTPTFFREVCGAVLPALAMYYLARSRKVTMSLLEVFFYIIFFSSIIAFFYETTTLMEEKQKEITSNSSYRFVYIMPFVCMLKGNIRVFFLWIVAIGISLLSAKRGAILGIGLECAVYYYWQYAKSKHKILYLLGFGLLVIILGYFIYDYYQNNLYLQIRVADTLEGKTSGRDKIVSKLLDGFGNFGLINIIFGKGFASTVKIAGNYAHNDWLEMLIDCGFIGFIFYLLFYMFILRSMRFIKPPYKHVLCLIFIAFFFSSFYSMVFFTESSSIGFLWLGLIIGWYDSYRYNKTTRISKKIKLD